jgi:outer membrane protein TolC
MRNASVPAGALVALALIAVPTPRFELQAQEAVSLEDAVALALARSPSYVQAEVSVESAQEDRRTAVGAFLPTLSLSTGASMRPGSVFDPTTQSLLDVTNRSLSGGVNVGMDLFSGGRNRAELSRADVEIEAADAALEGERFQLILQTKQLFFGALEQADLLGVAEARVARAEESLAIAVRQLAVGAATSSDSLRAQLELANARQAALQSEAQLRAARVALGRHVGVAGPVEALRPEDLEPSPLPLSDGEIFALAEGSSPGVRSASLNADASGASLTSARAAYYPTARISSGYNWSNDAWDVSGGQGRWSGLSLSLSYSVFNGFSREASVARAEDQVRVSRLQAEDAQLQARQEADAALFALRTSEEAVRIAEEAARVAEEDLRVVRERYEVGVATLFEVVTSQLALDEAETSRVSTRYDYLIARAELEAILGREL